MSVDTGKQPMNERLQHLFNVISGRRFLEKKALNGEIPFYICAYPPEESVDMERLQRQLFKRLEQNGVKILEINLYDLSIEILNKEDDFNWLIKNEPVMSKQKFIDEFTGILDVESVLIPAIAQVVNSTDFDVLFLSGVGEVFPYIRSHNVLNNLQSTAKEKPTVMFFPGVYTHSQESGASLDLFGKLHDDKYYRAFDISHCEA